MQNGQTILINGREYRLDGILSTGAGSYGQVWAATDPAGQAVALKFINAEAMSQADPSLHGHWRAHLQREIDFLKDLEAPQSRHIIALLDHGQADSQPVLVLERLQANLGQWLFQLRRDGGTPPDLTRILDWAEQILDGLDVIHRAGFVYRDLKFSNILVDAEGALLKLADFGSLKREDGDSTRSCIGTPATMAPEQILPIRQGDKGYEYAVDFRADYYALGLLLFTLLTGQATTTAQRRLGQLLAMYGQEGASHHRTELGGLTDEEQILLRRSIEFWTVPVNPEQAQGGAARQLTDLLIRLLARDPAGRPSSSPEIRAVFAALGPDALTASPLTPYGLTLPPDIPPNRPVRRSAPPARPLRLRRAVGVIGAVGLAGALAWATMIHPTFYAPPASKPTPVAPSAPVASVPPVAEPKLAAPAHPAPPLATTPSQTEPSPAATPTIDPAASETPTAPTIALDQQPVAPLADPARHAESVQSPTPSPPESTVAKTPAPSAPEVASDTAPKQDAGELTDADQPVAGTATKTTTAKPTETQPSTLSPSEATAQSDPKPAESEPAPAIPGPPMQPTRKKIATPQPAKTGARPLNASATRKPDAGENATPPAVERARPNAPRKILADKAPKPASIPVDSAEKPDNTPIRETTSRSSRPAIKTPPVATVIKPASQSPEPGSPLATPRRWPAPVKATERRPMESIATPASNAQAIPKAESAKAVRPSRGADLPAIDLVSTGKGPKPLSAPTRPPIDLISRPSPQAAPANNTAPPIELVSRSQSLAPAPPARLDPPPPRPVVAARIPAPEPAPLPRKRLARPNDPIRAFQEDAGRAANNLRREAENMSDWARRAGSSVGTEIRRSLDSANQAISGLVGNCTPANGCQPARRVERRDRWSQTNGGLSPNAQPPGFHEDAGADGPPARRPQTYR